MGFAIETAVGHDRDELLGLMRRYCDFYEVAPTDAQLLAIVDALIADPAGEGTQLIARLESSGAAVGFATIFWTWSTTTGARIGVMNDLFVAETTRGRGIADALIEACRDRCRARGADELRWTTAHENHRAQRVYDRVGGQRDDRWLDYSIVA